MSDNKNNGFQDNNNWRKPIQQFGLVVIAVAILLLVGSCTTSGDTPRDTEVPPVSSEPDETGYFDSDGLSIYYEIWGTSGKPIILAHGWGSNSDAWTLFTLMSTLSGTRKIIAVDSRGHGKSDKPHVQSLYSYAALSRDVLNLMDYLGIQQADILGHSMGAFMAEYLLTRHQDRLTSAIMIGIGDELETVVEESIMIAAALREPNPDDITDPLGQGMRWYIDSYPGNDNEAMALACLQQWPETFPLVLGGPYLADVVIPVLIINGSEDYYSDTDDAFAAAIPGAQLLTVEGADHVNVMVSDTTKDSIIDFLKAQD